MLTISASKTIQLVLFTAINTYLFTFLLTCKQLSCFWFSFQVAFRKIKTLIAICRKSDNHVARTHTHTRARAHTSTHTHARTHTHKYTRARTHAHTHAHTHTHWQSQNKEWNFATESSPSVTVSEIVTVGQGGQHKAVLHVAWKVVCCFFVAKCDTTKQTELYSKRSNMY
jgi:hypothetical protein